MTAGNRILAKSGFKKEVFISVSAELAKVEKSRFFARGSLPAPSISEFRLMSSFTNLRVGFSKEDIVFSKGLKLREVVLKKFVLEVFFGSFVGEPGGW